MYNFDFVKPGSVADAVAALAGEDALPLSGGQTLIPSMKARLNAPGTLVSLTGIPDLVGVCREGDMLVIGAAYREKHGTGLARDAAGPIFPGSGRLGRPERRSGGAQSRHQSAEAGPINDPLGPCLPGSSPWHGCHHRHPTGARLARMTISKACSPPR